MGFLVALRSGDQWRKGSAVVPRDAGELDRPAHACSRTWRVFSAGFLCAGPFDFANFFATICLRGFAGSFNDFHRGKTQFAGRAVRVFPKSHSRNSAPAPDWVNLIFRERLELGAFVGKINQRHPAAPKFKLKNGLVAENADFVVTLA